MNERIVELRKALNMTQQSFADRIGTKRNTVANYEIGRSEPSAAVVSMICREFHVNEEWLRTGEGEMFRQQSRDESIRAFVDDLLSDRPDSFRLRFVSCLAKLNDHEWEVIADLAERLAAENDETDASEPTVEELEEEYKKRISSSASNEGSHASNTTAEDASGVA